MRALHQRCPRRFAGDFAEIGHNVTTGPIPDRKAILIIDTAATDG